MHIYASEFPEPTGACSRPSGGLKHVTKCKISAVVDPAVSYTSYLELLKIMQVAIAFDRQFEPPPSPLKEIDFLPYKLKNRNCLNLVIGS